jgi:ribosomal protein S18 acetylase RimI-like enzyme
LHLLRDGAPVSPVTDTPVRVGDDLLLRRLAEGDIPAVRTVLSGAFESEQLGQEVGSRLEDYCVSGQAGLTLDEQVRESLPTEYWVMVETGGEVLGICGLYRFSWAWKRSFWLGWFAVAPSRQNRGMGAIMLTTLLRIARSKGCQVFKVETGKGGKATAFYKKLGFVEEGVLSRHYSQNLDALVLSRDLSDVLPLDTGTER